MYLPSLNLMAGAYKNFTSSFDPRGQISRLSNGSRRSISGVITTTAAGVARIDYTQAGGFPGWLIEGQRTNLSLYSSSRGSWSYNQGGISPDVALAPDGTITADRFVENSANAWHEDFQTLSKAASAITYCHSVYIGPSSAGRYVVLYVADASASNGVSLYFDPTTGTITQAASAYGSGWTIAGSGVEPLPGGWTRVWVAGTSDTTTSIRYGHRYANAGTGAGTGFAFVGNGSSYVTMWGAQIEAGSFPTSYIPTTGAQATRTADMMSIPTSVIPDFSATEGTVYISAEAALYGGVVWQLDDGTDADRLTLYTDLSGRAKLFGAPLSLNLGTVVTGVNTVYRAAAAFKNGDYAICVNGGAVETQASGTYPANPFTTLRLGASVAGSFLSGRIYHIVYWPRRLPNADLQTLTM